MKFSLFIVSVLAAIVAAHGPDADEPVAAAGGHGHGGVAKTPKAAPKTPKTSAAPKASPKLSGKGAAAAKDSAAATEDAPAPKAKAGGHSHSR